jgi:3,4-dihydroxy 2-butanone 4-phosphate synthase/GTP cyclohydrolase II
MYSVMPKEAVAPKSAPAPDASVEEVASARLPSAHAPEGLTARAFRSRIDGVEHLALVKGQPAAGALVRVHSECLTGDALGSLRCDCGEQLRAAMALIGASESGALIYVRGHEGRGIGLANKIAAYALQDEGLDTAQANSALGFPHDLRNYEVAARILKAIGLTSIRLLSNNPRKAEALSRHGVKILEEVPLIVGANPQNADYLAAKRDTLGHRLPGASPPSGQHPLQLGLAVDKLVL